MISVLLVLLLVFFPALVIFLCNKHFFSDWISAFAVCCTAGAQAGNIAVLPAGFAKARKPKMLINTCLALPLVPMAATALKKRGIVINGVVTGIIGRVSSYLSGHCRCAYN